LFTFYRPGGGCTLPGPLQAMAREHVCSRRGRISRGGACGSSDERRRCMRIRRGAGLAAAVRSPAVDPAGARDVDPATGHAGPASGGNVKMLLLASQI